MGNIPSKRSDRTAARNDSCRSSRHAGSLHGTTQFSVVTINDDDADFGRFLVDVQLLLTLENINYVATALGFKRAHLDLLARSENPQFQFMQMIREKGIISETDISAFISALNLCDFRGISAAVNRAFQKYRDKSTTAYMPDVLKDNKNTFISELKATYQDIYEAVQPIPYIRDKLCCVDRVFVEGGIEYLVAKETIEGKGKWQKLPTYHDILNDDRVRSTRRILEGDPGYGKSTLALQFAYDWCNQIDSSYLKNTDVLIFLRLRQLGGVPSIYRAIRKFLLPKDSQLNEADIESILSQCTSVLIILDGFDEYPDKDNDNDPDVIKIIARRMFQQFEVILTTRSSYFPKKYPALTKRLKLTGFDDKARDQYIRQAVVNDDVEATNNIKYQLKENPVLNDLCQVPFLFVMFAHISHESEISQKFTTVTSFFRYIISCFHSHMKNKMKDENVENYDLFETEHKELDKLAFQALCDKNQKIVWRRKYMREQLGKAFYDQYVRLGILVEEEVLDFSEHIQYKTETRFYHKLFCEWYAAYFLSNYAASNDVIFLSPGGKIPTRRSIEGKQYIDLDHLDPLDVQYVYRFACGINPLAGEKIVSYLTDRNKTDTFPILCILEQGRYFQRVLHHVKDLCSTQVVINKIDSILLQRTIIQLLEIAVNHKISISWVKLLNCCSISDLSGETRLLLRSNLSISVLTTLEVLQIWETDREIQTEEFEGILQYSSMCLRLEKLLFHDCVLPLSVKAEHLSRLRCRHVTVIWCPRDIEYHLNLDSGHWELEDGSEVMTDVEHRCVAGQFIYGTITRR